ncbi:MAG: DNA primase [Bacteroidota bacterium]|nr:DNA primase [Bacteroidota bacterium]
MKIPQEKFDEIAQANDIIDVISSYVQVKKRGKSFLALCPFHPDKNPSLHISQEKQVYHCFSCKASGNVYSFVQNYEKITFIDAVQKLAQRAGIELRFNAKDPDLSNEISKLFEINKTAAKYFHSNIKKLSGNEKEFIYNYLDKRKIDSKLVDKFGIGYASKNWDNLLNYFSEENIFVNSDIGKAGLLIKKENDENFYDRFRGRLMFPIFNENDKVVGFGGRKLFEDDLGGKYINSPETKIYTKSKILYGLNFAKEKIRYFDYVILVEGYMDLISLYKNGIENVVASSGTALSEEQVKLISRYTKNIYVLFDSDFAGIKAARRGIEIILEAGLDLSVITLPDGEDPDSFMNKYGKEEFEKYVTQKKSVINFISEIYEKENKLESVNDKTDFIKEIINYIGKIPDKLKRALYIKEVSKMYSLYESDMRDELEKVVKENKTRAFPKSSVVIPEKKASGLNSEEKIYQPEKDLLLLFIKGDEDAISFVENNLETRYIKSNLILQIIEHFLDEYINMGKVELTKVINNFESDDIKSLITEITMDKHEPSYFENATRDNWLNATTVQKFNLTFAKIVIEKLKLRERKEERKLLAKFPAEKEMEIFNLDKEIFSIENNIQQWNRQLS